jgi:hypothetical protein
MSLFLIAQHGTSCSAQVPAFVTHLQCSLQVVVWQHCFSTP